MELILILRVLMHRWYLVALPVVIAAALMLGDFLPGRAAASDGGGFTSSIRYTAAQDLSAIPNRDGDFQDVWLSSEFTVLAFTEWIRTSQFASEVNAVLAAQGLEVDTTGRFASDNKRSIGVLFASWEDAAQLEQIMAAALDVMQNRSSDYFPQLGTAPAIVRIMDTPVISATPPPITNRLRPLLQLAVALVGGVLLAFVVEYLDPMLRRREQVEALNIRVIASIPRE
jgi:capsular polysaccharide biosynthesis protein